MGFLYMSAKDEKEFAEHVDDFCDPNVNRFKQPVLFEVFTTAEGEIEGLDAICRESVKQPKKCSNVVKAISCFIPDKQKRRDFRRNILTNAGRKDKWEKYLFSAVPVQWEFTCWNG